MIVALCSEPFLKKTSEFDIKRLQTKNNYLTIQKISNRILLNTIFQQAWHWQKGYRTSKSTNRSWQYDHKDNENTFICIGIHFQRQYKYIYTFMGVYMYFLITSHSLGSRVGLTAPSRWSKLLPLVFLLQFVSYLRKHLILSISDWFWGISNFI